MREFFVVVGAVLVTLALLVGGLRYIGVALQWRARGCDPGPSLVLPLFYGEPGTWDSCRMGGG